MVYVLLSSVLGAATPVLRLLETKDGNSIEKSLAFQKAKEVKEDAESKEANRAYTK